MTAKEIVDELKSLGNEGYKKIMLNHGAKEPIGKKRKTAKC